MMQCFSIAYIIPMNFFWMEFYDTDLSNTVFLEGLKSFNTNLVEILYQVIYFLRVSHRFL